MLLMTGRSGDHDPEYMMRHGERVAGRGEIRWISAPFGIPVESVAARTLSVSPADGSKSVDSERFGRHPATYRGSYLGFRIALTSSP